MKRKLAIVVTVIWTLSIVSGWTWEKLRQISDDGSCSKEYLVIQRLSELYGARKFDAVVSECNQYELDGKRGGFEPQLIFIHWAAAKHLGLIQEAATLQKDFLKRYPHHTLGADMHFNSAMNLLAHGDLSEAEGELQEAVTCNPGSLIATKSNEILNTMRLSDIPTSGPDIGQQNRTSNHG